MGINLSLFLCKCWCNKSLFSSVFFDVIDNFSLRVVMKYSSNIFQKVSSVFMNFGVRISKPKYVLFTALGASERGNS